MSRFAPTLVETEEISERLLIRVVSEEAELAAMSDEWENLCRESPDSEFFVSWHWLQAWWSEYRGDSSLRICTVRSKDGQLLGVLPTYLKQIRSVFHQKYYELRYIGTGPGPTAGYFDLIARPKDRGRVSRAISPMLLGPTAVWDYLNLESMPAESPLTRRLSNDLSDYGLGGIRSQCPIVELPPDWSLFLQMLSDDVRESVSQVRERFSFESSMSLAQAHAASEINSTIDSVMRLGEKERPAAQWQSEVNLMRRVARKSAELGLAWGFSINRDGEAVASLLGFVWQQTFYCTQTVVNSRMADAKLDLLLASFAVEQAIKLGCQRCDFLGAATEAIRNFAPQTRETATVTAYRNAESEKRVRWVRRLGGK